MNTPCPVCDFPKVLSQLSGNGDATDVMCPRCGRFRLTGTATMLLPRMEHAKRARLSGVLRNSSDSGETQVVASDNLDSLLARAPATFSISRLVEGVLLLVADKTMQSGNIRAPVVLDDTDYTPFYLGSWDDFIHVLVMMREQHLVHLDGIVGTKIPVQLKVGGWERVDQLQSTRGRPDRAFVAMWFDESVKPAYDDGIEPALRATGYDPIRIDLVAHTDRIDDKILAEIRRSGLLVADFTGQRQGVYFETGFALGLGIPVIWCCKKEDFERTHFDTRQYNHIVWTDETSLRLMLKTRIQALGLARNGADWG